jgi:phosphoglycolate phosphatase
LTAFFERSSIKPKTIAFAHSPAITAHAGAATPLDVFIYEPFDFAQEEASAATNCIRPRACALRYGLLLCFPHLSSWMLRNVIFDWSGTLADDLGPVVAATNLIFGRFGKAELLLEEFRERFRLPFDAFDDDLLSGVALDELEPRFPEHLIDCQHAVVLLPHALEFLRFCQATRRRVFLLSPIKEAHFAEQSARLGVAHFFERIYVGVADQRTRIREILTNDDLAATETAFIGDTVRDIETARAGGVMSIATLTGFNSREELCRANPDAMVRDLGELQRLLELVPPNDEIRIEALELMARVGVPDLERAEPQRVAVSLTLQPRRAFGDLGDNLARTIDYAAVCEDLRRFVARRQDKLIETLAHEMAEHLLRRFGFARVELELRKFVLPETRYVAVRVVRQPVAAR